MPAQTHDAHPSDATSTGGGARRSIGRIVVAVLVVAYVGGMTAAITAGIIARQHTTTTHRTVTAACSTEPALTIAAAPEIAPVVEEVVRTGLAKQAAAAGCHVPQVTPQRPVDVLDAIRSESGDRPDVWIPDSSIWTGQTMPPGRGVPQGSPSVAKSPMVLAVPRADAPRATRNGRTLTSLLPTNADAGVPIRWGLPDPQTSPAAVGAVLALQQATAGRGDGPGILGNVLRTSQRDLPSGFAAQLDAAVAGHLAVPASEQALVAYNAKHGAAAGVVTVRLGNPGYTFDYPYVVLAAQHSRRAQADELLAELRAPAGRQVLAAAGFRDAGARLWEHPPHRCATRPLSVTRAPCPAVQRWRPPAAHWGSSTAVRGSWQSSTCQGPCRRRFLGAPEPRGSTWRCARP